MRKSVVAMATFAAVPAVLLLALWGCGGSSSSRGGSTTAPVTSSPTAPTAAVTSASAESILSGTAQLHYVLSDPSGADRDLLVRYSLDGGTSWSVTSDAPGGDGRDDLAATPQGVPHVYHWDTVADVPSSATVLVELRAVDGNGETLGPLVVDNEPLSSVIPLSRRPYIQSPLTDSAIIAWNTTNGFSSTLEYGETPSLGKQVIVPGQRTAHAVTLSGLTPGTRYYYRLVTGHGDPLTHRLFFETAPVGPTPFTVVAFGDSGKLTTSQAAVAQAMTAEDADLYLHLGDIIYPNGGAGDGFRHYQERFFDFYGDMLDTRPMWPASGNHDALALFGPFKEAFHLPHVASDPLRDELYYSFVWGDVKFVVLETTILHRIPTGAHMDWLRRELSTPERWKVVLAHHPLYSSGHHGDDILLQLVLEPILEDHRVDIVLAGHEHHYERIKRQRRHSSDPTYAGPTYFISGGGGTSLRGVTPNANAAVAISAHHFLRLRFDGSPQCTVEAVDTTGTVIDSVVIDDQ